MSHLFKKIKSSELWGHMDEMVRAVGYPTSDLGRFEFESMMFYGKHCIQEEDTKFKKIFKDENGKVKHICFIKVDAAHSVLDQ